MDRLGGLVVIAPARRAGDPGSNPGPGEKKVFNQCPRSVLANQNNYSGQKNKYYLCMQVNITSDLREC